MAQAHSIARSMNPNALVAEEGGRVVIVEDVKDSDGRVFRVEYRCDDDGGNAQAWVLYNPWGANRYSYEMSHLRDDGFVCYTDGLTGISSPRALRYAMQRVRFWCTCFSFLMQHGYAETCRLVPEWEWKGR